MFAQGAWSTERVALVIGNASYPSAPLKNAARDAQAIERTLSRLGFAVTRVENADRARMMRAVQDFRVRLQRGSVGFFYYSGHGVEIDGKNFLLPVGAAIRSQEDVLVEALDAGYVVAQMEAAGSALNLVVLDACRDNPLPAATRTAGKGLARMDGGTGTLIAFATAAGQVADDGAGTNSPYTSVLLEQLARPGLSVAEVFNETNLEVARLTGNRQRPWYSTSGVPTIRLAGVGVVQQPSPALAASEGELRIEVSPPSARVRVDGVLLGTGSRSVKEMAGTTVVVRAEADGHEPLEERVRVQGGQVADVVLRLRPLVVVQAAPVNAHQDAAPVTATVGRAAGTVVIDANAPAPAVGQPYRRRLKSGGEGPEMVVVPGGSFLVGSPESEEGRETHEGPQRRSTIGSFAMGVTEVTFADWDLCVAAGGCRHPQVAQNWGRGADRPVINVTWDDAQAYVQWLSGETARRYRLPTEAEWEYAARAGTTTAYWWGDEIGSNLANCYGCGSRWDGQQTTAPVKSFAANPWGLYDTSGNVWEWVHDCRARVISSARDCGHPIRRGGGWNSPPTDLRSAARKDMYRSVVMAYIGLRVAEDL